MINLLSTTAIMYLLCKAASQLVGSQLILVHGVILPKLQDCAFSFGELQ